MELIHYKHAKKGTVPLVLGIGKFDGFHAGHRKIAETITGLAGQTGALPSVFTFRHYPVEFYLSSWAEKQHFFKKAGIARCIWSDFEEISFWPPERFTRYIADLGAAHVVVGFNFGFGAHKAGDVEFLRREGNRLGFDVTAVAPVVMAGTTVSSTAIRNALKTGDPETARVLLGRYFSFEGKVITGRQRGRILEFPTANLYPLNRIELADGIYAAWVRCENTWHKGAINIGNSPTFAENEFKIEVHLLDFHRDIYGEVVRVYLVKKIRDEIAFPSPEALTEAIAHDIFLIREILTTPPMNADGT